MPHTSSFPPRPSLFVGRKRELEEIREALHWGHFHEVLKIIGPPGVGKTALVREAFEDEPRRFLRTAPLWFRFGDIPENLEEFDKTLRGLLDRETSKDLYDKNVICRTGLKEP